MVTPSDRSEPCRARLQFTLFSGDFPVAKPEVATPVTATTPTLSTEVVPVGGAAAKILAGLSAARREGGALGGASLKVLHALREKGDKSAGMTAREVMAMTGQDAKEARKRIRMAQDAAAKAGDLCLAVKVGGGARNSKCYLVVRRALATTFGADEIKAIREGAEDYAFAGEVKGRFAGEGPVAE